MSNSNPTIIWVEFNEREAKKVSPGTCEDLDDLKMLCVRKFGMPTHLERPYDLEVVESEALNYETRSKDGTPLNPGMKLSNLSGNSGTNPVKFVKVTTAPSAVPGPNVVVPLASPSLVDNSLILARELGTPLPEFPSTAQLTKALLAPLAKIISVSNFLPCDYESELRKVLNPHSADCLNYPEISVMFGNALFVPADGGSECNHILLWDTLIKRPLQILSKYSETVKLTFDRDTVDPSTATLGSKRPDRLCWLNDALVLKGEEKALSSDFGIAVEELRAKCGVWSHLYFGSLDYYFAYAAGGQLLKFYAIDPAMNVNAISRQFDLSSPLDRVQVVCYVINIFRCMQYFPEKIPTSPPFPLFTICKRATSEILIMQNKVQKKIKNFGKDFNYSTLQDLQNIYQKTETFPNIIHAISGPRCSKTSTYFVELAPLGFRRTPVTLNELKRAVHGVLMGLYALHQFGYVHRDLRWENVLQKQESSWMLIDLEHAGQEGPVSYRLSYWPDGIGGDGGAPYTYSCDLYLVGKLIADTGLDVGEEGKDFRDFLIDSNILTEDVLGHSWLQYM